MKKISIKKKGNDIFQTILISTSVLYLGTIALMVNINIKPLNVIIVIKNKLNIKANF